MHSGIVEKRLYSRFPEPVFLFLLIVLALMPASATAAGSSQARLEPPQWISLNEFRGGVNLRWFRVQGAVEYIVWRRDGTEGEFRLRAKVNHPVYDDFMTEPGKGYFYRIVPIDMEGTTGSASVERYYKVPPREPEYVEPPRWSMSHIREDGIALGWDHASPDHVLGYNLYRKGPGESTFSLISSSLDINFLDRDLVPGRTYSYVITALDRKLQESDNSEVLKISFSGGKSVRSGDERLKGLKTLEEVVSPTSLIEMFTWEEYGFISPVDVDYRTYDQRLYVSDSGTGFITVIDPRGQVVAKLGGVGDKPWEFDRLLGIALAEDGSLYAVDAYRGDVVVFSSQGGFRSRIRLRTMVQDYFGPGLMKDFPWFRFGLVDLTFGQDGSLYIVDNPNGWIYHLDKKAELVEVLAGRGYEPGQMQYPTFIASGLMGKLFVADTMNSRVQILEGLVAVPRIIGGKGTGIGQFVRPKGVTVDRSGFLYVADSYMNVVQVFDAEGGFAALLGDERGMPIDLGSPNGLLLVPPDTLIVCERLARRIQVRKLPVDLIHQFPKRIGR